MSTLFKFRLGGDEEKLYLAFDDHLRRNEGLVLSPGDLAHKVLVNYMMRSIRTPAEEASNDSDNSIDTATGVTNPPTDTTTVMQAGGGTADVDQLPSVPG